MKKARHSKSDPDLLEEYDFSHGVRGKYIDRLAAGSNLVLLAPDVIAAFPTSDAVNDALRLLIKVAKTTRKTPRGSTRKTKVSAAV
ncbi:MAG: hypothetical protein HY710_02905 [Candidatus Latescibacteria bacterium]|nr:hypothetical protein [Candidatus Latescibacterota bacterium]